MLHQIPVYGSEGAFEESDFVDHPVSLYAATKKSSELMAIHTAICSGYRQPALGFYGIRPNGRPDMAYFSFTNKYFVDLSGIQQR